MRLALAIVLLLSFQASAGQGPEGPAQGVPRHWRDHRTDLVFSKSQDESKIKQLVDDLLDESARKPSNTEEKALPPAQK